MKLTNPMRTTITWLVTGVASTMLLSGCIVIPADFYAYGSRHNVTVETGSKLKPGITTREEVLLMLGEPDYGYNDDELILAYKWEKVRAIAVAGGPGGAGVGAIVKYNQLNIKFDENDRVSEVGLIENIAPSQ